MGLISPPLNTSRRSSPRSGFPRTATLGVAACLAVLALGAQAQDGDGLVKNSTGRWTPRMTPQLDERGQFESVGLLGDYAFATAGVAGLRATGGLVWGTGTTRMASSERFGGVVRDPRFWNSALPGANQQPSPRTAAYFGLGYTRTDLRAGWRVQADLGMAWRLTPDSVKLGASDTGMSLEDVLRDARLAPLMHLSVSYSF
jgi:hypothetical protein